MWLRVLQPIEYWAPCAIDRQSVRARRKVGDIVPAADIAGQLLAIWMGEKVELIDAPAPPYPSPPPPDEWPKRRPVERPGPPPWELGGAAPPREPAHGRLECPAALRQWGDRRLLDWFEHVERMTSEAREAFQAADQMFREWRQERYRNQLPWHLLEAKFPDMDPVRPSERRDLLEKITQLWSKAATAAYQELHADFKERWFAGEFFMWGERGGPLLVRSFWRESLDLFKNAPHVRFQGGAEPDIHHVRVYRVVDHPNLVNALAGERQPIGVSAAPDVDQSVPGGAEGNRSQSAKAVLRGRVKDILNREARAERENGISVEINKAGWLRRVRNELGEAGDAVTDHLFNAVWREADIPRAWRAPGRRT